MPACYKLHLVAQFVGNSDRGDVKQVPANSPAFGIRYPLFLAKYPTLEHDSKVEIGLVTAYVVLPLVECTCCGVAAMS